MKEVELAYCGLDCEKCPGETAAAHPRSELRVLRFKIKTSSSITEGLSFPRRANSLQGVTRFLILSNAIKPSRITKELYYRSIIVGYSLALLSKS